MCNIDGGKITAQIVKKFPIGCENFMGRLGRLCVDRVLEAWGPQSTFDTRLWKVGEKA